MFSRKIGIDLGTCNSIVFTPHKGVVLSEPSVVAVALEEVAVGEVAVVVGEGAEEEAPRFYQLWWHWLTSSEDQEDAEDNGGAFENP